MTLFEGSRVIKAKKTRPLSCAEVLHFNEKFSIRLPSSYLDSVSCVVSLCSRWEIFKGEKLKHGIYDIFAGINLESKQWWEEQTLVRLLLRQVSQKFDWIWLQSVLSCNFSPFAGQGLEHWQEMSQRPGREVVKWHKMVTNSSWQRGEGKTTLLLTLTRGSRWSAVKIYICDHCHLASLLVKSIHFHIIPTRIT